VVFLAVAFTTFFAVTALVGLLTAFVAETFTTADFFAGADFFTGAIFFVSFFVVAILLSPILRTLKSYHLLIKCLVLVDVVVKYSITFKKVNEK